MCLECVNLDMVFVPTMVVKRYGSFQVVVRILSWYVSEVFFACSYINQKTMYGDVRVYCRQHSFASAVFNNAGYIHGNNAMITIILQ